MRDSFAKYHPLVNFLYFALVIGFSMALNHPIAQGISLVCAVIYAVQADGRKGVLFTLKWCLPIMLLTAFMNPAFSHEGVTILLYFPTGNPLTLESILYGISAGVMIATVMPFSLASFFSPEPIIFLSSFLFGFCHILSHLYYVRNRKLGLQTIVIVIFSVRIDSFMVS